MIQTRPAVPQAQVVPWKATKVLTMAAMVIVSFVVRTIDGLE